MSRVAYLVAVAVFLAAPAAANEKTLLGAESLNAVAGARQMGMGGAGIVETGLTGSWVNPAMLAGLEGRWGAALTGGPLFTGVEGMDSSSFLGGAGWKIGEHVVMGLSGYVSNVKLDRFDEAGLSNGEAGNSLTCFGLTGAYGMDWISFGITAKIVGENFGGYDDDSSVSNNKISSDFGVVMSRRGFILGVALRNLGPDLYNWTGQEGRDFYERQPTEGRLGASYLFKSAGLRVAADVGGEPSSDGSPTFGVGAEWWPSPMFAVRTGVEMPGAGPNVTAGLSVVLKSIGVDWGMKAVGLTGFTTRVGVTYTHGRSAAVSEPEPEPEPAREEKPVKEEKPATTARPAGGKLNFAIAELSPQGVSASDSAVIADLLRGELVKTGAFTIIEKQNMDKVLAEQGFQQTGCTSEECAVKIGKLLNVQRMAVGSFGKLMDVYVLSIRVVNVETGAIGFAESIEGEKVADLRKGIKDLALRMSRQIR